MIKKIYFAVISVLILFSFSACDGKNLPDEGKEIEIMPITQESKENH